MLEICVQMDTAQAAPQTAPVRAASARSICLGSFPNQSRAKGYQQYKVFYQFFFFLSGSLWNLCLRRIPRTFKDGQNRKRKWEEFGCEEEKGVVI